MPTPPETDANPLPPRVVAVIPARIGSTRLHRKVLVPLLGRPLLAWVVEAAMRCKRLDKVIVATDSDEVSALCDHEGWHYQQTDASLPSGTDRMHAVSLHEPADIYINIQGDEPLLQPEHVDALLRPFEMGGHVAVTTVKTPCTPENIHNPNAVKVVTAEDGRALYFSRAAVPFDRDGAGTKYWKHLGLYAYRREALMHFASLMPGALEQTERLEQVQLLENGLGLYVEPVEFDTVGVDTVEDLLRVERILRERAELSREN